MDDKLQKKIREAEDEHAEEALADHLAINKQIARDTALLLLGSFHAAQKIANAINSEVMRALEIFQAERMYLSFGYDRFVDFLEGYEHAPMSKAQYYERKALLDKEGDALFDMYGDLGVSIRKRKLLGKGNIEIDGENVLVRDGDEVTEIHLNDRSRLLQTLTALADANAEKSIKLERQKEKIDRHDTEKRDLYDEIDRVRASKAAASPDDHMIARVELGLAFAKLREAVLRLSNIENDQFRDSVLEDVAAWSADLREAYRNGAAVAPAANPEIVGDTFDEALGNFLDGVDLDAVDSNDGELLAQL